MEQHDNNVTKLDIESDKTDNSVIVAFLMSEQGQQLMNKAIDTAKHNSFTVKHNYFWDEFPRYVLAGLAITGGCFLSYYDKFDPSIAVLLGSVIGYMFAKD